MVHSLIINISSRIYIMVKILIIQTITIFLAGGGLVEIIKRNILLRNILLIFSLLLFSWNLTNVNNLFNSKTNDESFKLMMLNIFHLILTVAILIVLVKYINNKIKK